MFCHQSDINLELKEASMKPWSFESELSLENEQEENYPTPHLPTSNGPAGISSNLLVTILFQV